MIHVPQEVPDTLLHELTRTGNPLDFAIFKFQRPLAYSPGPHVFNETDRTPS